eukprot:c4579_g1_i1.p1 GENE.c4579_g1_i1~~c4579_g1_i1.p1  ORF type:complete len:169 (+),score=37.06 c4579_g1_i1:30-509(+)
MFSSSLDKTVKVWNSGLKLKRTLTMAAPVITMALHGNILAIGLANGAIELWNIRTWQSIATLPGHKRSLRALEFTNKWLVSCSVDGTLKIWSTHSINRSYLLTTTQSIQSLAMMNGHLISGGNDKTIRVWDVDSHVVTRTPSVGDLELSFAHDENYSEE